MFFELAFAEWDITLLRVYRAPIVTQSDEIVKSGLPRCHGSSRNVPGGFEFAPYTVDLHHLPAETLRSEPPCAFGPWSENRDL